MNSTPISVTAHLLARPGQEATVRQELLALLPITRQEPGCLGYDLHESKENPGQFLFYENWMSQQHLNDHLGRPHIARLLAMADELFAEPPRISLWERIG